MEPYLSQIMHHLMAIAKFGHKSPEIGNLPQDELDFTRWMQKMSPPTFSISHRLNGRISSGIERGPDDRSDRRDRNRTGHAGFV